MANINTNTRKSMPAMPALPRSSKIKPTRPCQCGCGTPTKGSWAPGHDGRATGWAVRVERGLMKLADVPDNERAGAEFMLKRRAEEKAREEREQAAS